MKIQKKSTKFGTAGLILSILSFFIPVAGLILAVLSIIFSAKQLKIEKTAPAKWGLGLGIISILFNLIVILIIALIFASINYLSKDIYGGASLAEGYRVHKCDSTELSLNEKKQCLDKLNLLNADTCYIIHPGEFEEYCFRTIAVKTANSSVCDARRFGAHNASFWLNCQRDVLEKTAVKCSYSGKQATSALFTFEEAPEGYKAKNSWGDYISKWGNHTKTVFQKNQDGSWQYSIGGKDYAPEGNSPQWVIEDAAWFDEQKIDKYITETFSIQGSAESTNDVWEYYKVLQHQDAQAAKAEFNTLLNGSRSNTKNTKDDYLLGFGEDGYSFVLGGNSTHKPAFITVYKQNNFVVATGADTRENTLKLAYKINNKICLS